MKIFQHYPELLATGNTEIQIQFRAQKNKTYTRMEDQNQNYWTHKYKGCHNGCCLAYIGNTINLDSNHYGGHYMYKNKEKYRLAVTSYISLFIPMIGHDLVSSGPLRTMKIHWYL